MQQLWILMLAIGFHELGHYGMARLQGVRMRRLTFGATGLRMLTDHRAFPSYESELWIALGGPCGNLIGNALFFALARMSGSAHLLILCQELIPLSLFLGIWNLLPIHGFDGGRVLHCLLLRGRCAPACAQRILCMTSAACFVLLWTLSIYLLLRTGRAFSLFWFCVQLFWGCWQKENGV